jgi:2-isopropylmalate synthase
MQVLTKVKEMEQEGYDFEAAEATFELLIRNTLEVQRPYFQLQEYYSSYRRDGESDYDVCAATVKLRVGNEEHHEVAEGDGPVNALDAALRKGLRQAYPMIDEMALEDYKVRIIDSHMGTGAKTRVLVVSSDGPENWSTVGVSYNIIQASWRALVDSLNFFLLKRGVEPLG